MISFTLYTLVHRPLKQVFTYVATPENEFQWQYGTLASALISQGEIRVGTFFRTVGHFMGRRMENVYEVTDFEPNTKYGFRSVSGPLDSHTLYTFEMVERSTRVIIATEANPTDLFQMHLAVVEKKYKKQYKENLAMLKSLLETYAIPAL